MGALEETTYGRIPVFWAAWVLGTYQKEMMSPPSPA